jgi:hypothetical protein
MAHNVYSIAPSKKMKWQDMPIMFPTKIEYPEHEDKLGWARCLIWGLVFEAAFSIAALAAWLTWLSICHGFGTAD